MPATRGLTREELVATLQRRRKQHLEERRQRELLYAEQKRILMEDQAAVLARTDEWVSVQALPTADGTMLGEVQIFSPLRALEGWLLAFQLWAGAAFGDTSSDEDA